VECGSTAIAVDSAEDSATANSNAEDSATAKYSLAANSATTNYSRIRPTWRKHWRNSSASPQCSNPANRRFHVKKMLTVVKISVPRIRDILRRRRILGSVHWITDRCLDPDLVFSAVAFKKPTKNNF
jgi:hypothetical protein